MIAIKENKTNRKVELSKDPLKLIKIGIWIYFALLIFEGGLRKWVFPNLSTPLLVIRDPFALWIIFLSWHKGIIPLNKYLISMVSLGIIALCTTMLLGHRNLGVAVYGARILVLHFPLIFIIGKVFTRKDLINMGKVLLWMAIPMSFLIAAQFYSPQSAFVNRGIGGDETGAGFSGALGFLRPPGTFSFTNGTSLFFGIVAPFVIYFWLNMKLINRFILIGATLSLFAAIPLSISRGLLFQVILCIVFSLLATSRKPEYLGRMLIAGVGGVIALFVLSNTSFFQTATEAFSHRIETAAVSEGGLEGTLVDRYLGGMIGALENSSQQPFFGYGIGMGTNVGSMLLSGDVVYLISEGEWGRLIGELGPIMGITVIFIRLAVSVNVLISAYKKLVLGDLLPWILLSFFLTNVPQGQWAQPTSLGFGILIGGLTLASLKTPIKSRIKIIHRKTKNLSRSQNLNDTVKANSI